mgnify:CR=1 FL=1
MKKYIKEFLCHNLPNVNYTLLPFQSPTTELLPNNQLFFTLAEGSYFFTDNTLTTFGYLITFENNLSNEQFSKLGIAKL